MKLLSKFTILLSTCVLLTACNSGGSNQSTSTPVPPQGQKKILYSFTGGVDGAVPKSEVIQGSDGNFYGTTYGGGITPSAGSVGYGTVFKITSSGVKTTIYNFESGPYDGANPKAALIQGSDGNFYGTTVGGGNGYGTVFKITPQGVESPLYSFKGSKSNNDGAFPAAELIQGKDGNFYGTTVFGGFTGSSPFELGGFGTVFKITPAGVETILYKFRGGTDGGFPWAGLILASDGNFYGTTKNGGIIDTGANKGYGTVFSITPAGEKTTLYSFNGNQNHDGAYPNSKLIQGRDNFIYGTTSALGVYFYGTAFKLTLQGQETVLYSFADGNDGANPQAGLIQASDGNFYGTTQNGGSGGYGTVFKLTPQGQETVLSSFADGNDGASPQAAVIQGSDGNLYGTTNYGGTPIQSGGNGTVFKISIK